jgi:tetratricopeptide (TPR) repeat protein
MSQKTGESGYHDTLLHLLREYPDNYLELSSYYMGSGLYREAADILERAVKSDNPTLNAYPSLHYYLGYLYHVMGEKEKAGYYFTEGTGKPIKYCFPFRLESMKVYQTALEYNPEDSRACYYMGNLLYDRQPEPAIQWWEKAIEFDHSLAMAHRNLGWGYQQTHKETGRAIGAYRDAIRYDPAHPRFYLELDKLLEEGGESIETRLELLSRNHQHVSKLQGALMREILVLVLAGEYDRAIELMDGRMFYRQEDVNILHDIHVDAHLLKGKQYLDIGDPEAALEEFLLADTYPENQMIERNEDYQRNARIFYYTGLACEAAGNQMAAREYYGRASSREDTDNEFLFYKAMALARSGKQEEADRIFSQMIELGKSQITDSGETGFFAKFGEELNEAQRNAISYQILGLGHLGLGNKKKAEEFFTRSLESDVNQLWSRIYLEEL